MSLTPERLTDILRGAIIARENEIRLLAETATELGAVCFCGCPDAAHENYGEDGYSCANPMHECMRCSPAVLAAVEDLRRRALPAKRCRKRGHDTPEIAAEVATSLARAGRGRFTPYRCHRCDRFHVGHERRDRRHRRKRK